MTTVNEQVAAFREVLRHLNHPERLRRNHLVATQFRPGGDPANAAARIRHLVESALDDLPVRQREIVRRCDLQGESHSSVTARLALSERHFYRERSDAFKAIAAALAVATRDATSRAADPQQNSVALQLCFADAAHQVGDTTGALKVLQNANRDSVDREGRIHLACRLAELCCEAGEIGEAKDHIVIARELAIDLDKGSQAVGTRIDAFEAMVAWRSGDSVAGVQFAERAVRALRRGAVRGYLPRDAEALAFALLVLNENDLTVGKLASARRQALEALDAIATSDLERAALTIRVESAATAAYMFDPTHLRDAAFELDRQYHHAIARGLTLEATLVGWRLANFHRFANAPRRAAEALGQMLPIARRVLASEERAGLCLDLASNYVALGEPSNAHRFIAEARTHALPHGFASALSYSIAADACLRERAYPRALDLSRVAAAAMERLGRQASVGSALRIQADANYGLGDVRRATQLIGAALSHLDGSGHPFVVANAHRSAARITGKRVHRKIAEEISALLRPAAL